MKFSYTLGAMGAFALALTATAALACPPKTAPPPTCTTNCAPPPCTVSCPPNPCQNPCAPNPCANPCKSAFSFVSANATSTQGGTGNITFMEQEHDIMGLVKVGPDARAESNVWATTTGMGTGTTAAIQQTNSTLGAGIGYNFGTFPAPAQAQFMGGTAANQQWVTNSPSLSESAMLFGKAKVDATEVQVSNNATSQLQGSGPGTYNQGQMANMQGAAVGWFNHPVPTASLFFIPAGVPAVLFQNITNTLQFLI